MRILLVLILFSGGTLLCAAPKRRSQPSPALRAATASKQVSFVLSSDDKVSQADQEASASSSPDAHTSVEVDALEWRAALDAVKSMHGFSRRVKKIEKDMQTLRRLMCAVQKTLKKLESSRDTQEPQALEVDESPSAPSLYATLQEVAQRDLHQSLRRQHASRDPAPRAAAEPGCCRPKARKVHPS